MLEQTLASGLQKAMLYERWRQIARERPDAFALREFPSNRCWTFAELADAAEKLPAADQPLMFAQGHSAGFVFDVLRAWRDHAVLCPLEIGQPNPALPAPPKPACHLKLTSATTGPARAVVFTAEQIAADAENIVVTMGLRPDWPNLGAISLAHSYGFSNLILPLLLHGIPLILADSTLPETVRRAAENLSGLTLPAVPALWRTWHETNAIPAATRLAISAGAPLPADLESAVFQARGLKIHNFYGSTECGGIAYDATEVPRADGTCAGTPMRNVTLDSHDGCMRVASGAAGQSYWPAAAGSLGQGIFQTGDLAELRDGQVFLRGRLSEQINVAGRKISPAAIEQVLAAHPAVRECVVFGMPGCGAERHETIAACVVVRERVSAAELKQFLLARLPAWQLPREWHFVDSLAANERGKISRADWRKKFLARD
jgi:acyl-CoA synthetase (AMP-forming)/AMP-acid ligase II